MRTVVTGAAGFVGSHLVEKLLARGDEVVCIERPGAGPGWIDGMDIEFHDCGLGNPALLRDLVCSAEVIYHLAALTEARTPAECFEVNTLGTANVLKAAAGCRGSTPRVVFMSSLAAVGPAPDGEELTADTVPRPLSHYGRSKLHAEAVIHAFADRVPSVICRCPAVYGPRDRVVLKLFRMVAKGFALTIGPWDREVSVIHAQDAADGLVAAGTEPGSPGRTYYLANPEPVTWGDFVLAIGRALDRRPFRFAVPVPAARPIALAAEGAAWLSRRAAVLNRDRVRELSQSRWVCNSIAALTEIGFQPRFSLETGVVDTAVWLRRNQWI